MTTLNTKKIGLIVTTILAAGVVSGCEYCQPLLLATVSTAIIIAAVSWLKTNMSDDLFETLSHYAH